MNALHIDNTAHETVPEITTWRLVLKAPVKADVPALVKLANNKALAENLGTMPHPYCEEDALDWLNRPTGFRVDGAKFGVYLNIPNPVFIGTIGYGRQNGAGDPDLGYWIGRPYWGQGYATEAAMGVINHAFGEGNEARLLAGCRITNVGSRRVLEKCGFEYLGFGKAYCRALGEDVPLDQFALSRPHFRGLKLRREG